MLKNVQNDPRSSCQPADKTLPRLLTGRAPKIDLIRPKEEHTFQDDIVGLRTTLKITTDGTFDMVKDDPRLIPVTFAAMTDLNMDMAGNAQWLVMQLASSSSPKIKTEIRIRLRAFFTSKWMAVEKASGSWRYDDIKETLGPVLMNLDL